MDRFHFKFRGEAQPGSPVCSNPTSLPRDLVHNPAVQGEASFSPQTMHTPSSSLLVLTQTSLRTQIIKPCIPSPLYKRLCAVPIFSASSPATLQVVLLLSKANPSCVLNSFSPSQEFCSFGSLISLLLVTPSLLNIPISLFKNALLFPAI